MTLRCRTFFDERRICSNTTGPPRAAPDELRCICAALQTTTTDADRHQRAKQYWPVIKCETIMHIFTDYAPEWRFLCKNQLSIALYIVVFAVHPSRNEFEHGWEHNVCYCTDDSNLRDWTAWWCQAPAWSWSVRCRLVLMLFYLRLWFFCRISFPSETENAENVLQLQVTK